MGLLDGGGAALFGEIFSGTFLPASLRAGSGDVSYDNQGTLRRGAGNPRACRVQVDRNTERWRDEPGFSASDVTVIILASSLAGDAPVSGNIVTPERGPYADVPLRLATPIERDPVGAGWTARAVQERTPNA